MVNNKVPLNHKNNLQKDKIKILVLLFFLSVILALTVINIFKPLTLFNKAVYEGGGGTRTIKETQRRVNQNSAKTQNAVINAWNNFLNR